MVNVLIFLRLFGDTLYCTLGRTYSSVFSFGSVWVDTATGPNYCSTHKMSTKSEVKSQTKKVTSFEYLAKEEEGRFLSIFPVCPLRSALYRRCVTGTKPMLLIFPFLKLLFNYISTFVWDYCSVASFPPSHCFLHPLL